MSSVASSPSRTERAAQSDFVIRLRQNAGLITAVALFCLVYLFYHLVHPKGFSSAVLVQNADEVFTLATLAMAQTVPVLAAGLDLSVGALMTLVDCLASYLLTYSDKAQLFNIDIGALHLPILMLPGGVVGVWIGAIICLLTGLLGGFINGCVVVYGRIQPIIATLATGAIYMGLALYLRPTPGGKIGDDLNWATTNTLGDFASTVHIFDDGAAGWFAPIAWIPVPAVLLLVIAVVVWAPFRRTVTGRTVYAIGSAEGAAYMSGLA
ncbi:MAG TPA: ABC transporter permease, partial [Roseiarcus sp.]|nr:ABC transporter permease [Roseiarcus sp.]